VRHSGGVGVSVMVFWYGGQLGTVSIRIHLTVKSFKVEQQLGASVEMGGGRCGQ